MSIQIATDSEFLESERDALDTSIEWTVTHWLHSVLAAIALSLSAYFCWAREYGNSGFAAFVVGASILFITLLYRGAFSGNRRLILGCATFSLFAGCGRLVWQPNPLVVAACVVHLIWLTAILHGTLRGPLQMVLYSISSVIDGVVRWLSLPWTRILVKLTGMRWPWLSLGIPVLVAGLFLFPLMQSHPDLTSRAYAAIMQTFESLKAWMTIANLPPLLLSVFVGIWSLGLMLPYVWRYPNSKPDELNGAVEAYTPGVYLAARNTLIMVGCVFVGFLILEFQTMWFRDFPEGFRYSAYAHEGAAWLTAVLAMSTALLSIVFQPYAHRHPKIATLKWLAWFWFACNLLLVVAVFHRMAIYVQYNGLTRLRIVGFVGAGCVFVGFMLVIVKIIYERSFAWLCRTQIWAFVFSIYLLGLLPMDSISHGWNVWSVGRGNLRPLVQLSVQPLSDEGLMCIFPLMHHEEPTVREGVMALLAERMMKIDEEDSFGANSNRWTHFSGSKFALRSQLEQSMELIEPWLDSFGRRGEALDKLRKWTERWY